MASKQDKALAQAVLYQYGQTFSEQLRIHAEQNAPSSLFQLLVFSLLSSTRISHEAAMTAFEALRDAGWTTPEKMAAATWAERVEVLNTHGYARYDESTSRMLEETCRTLLDKYGGDLRNLRQQAARDVDKERERLKEFKGIGDVGAAIFLREVQVVWEEVFPFADQRALEAASNLGLPRDVDQLRELTGDQDFPRLVAGLVQVALADGYDSVRQAAEA
ncbi:MAG: hypothetical protein ACOC93_02405 [Planctomycetota bacterium]